MSDAEEALYTWLLSTARLISTISDDDEPLFVELTYLLRNVEALLRQGRGPNGPARAAALARLKSLTTRLRAHQSHRRQLKDALRAVAYLHRATIAATPEQLRGALPALFNQLRPLGIDPAEDRELEVERYGEMWRELGSPEEILAQMVADHGGNLHPDGDFRRRKGETIQTVMDRIRFAIAEAQMVESLV